MRIDSFDAPALKALTIGIQVTGDDYNNPPAAQELASRHMVQNVRGFTIYGDYSRPDPQRDIVDAVADGRVDVAVVWGPLAGYYAQRQPTPIDVRPIAAGSTRVVAVHVRHRDGCSPRRPDAASRARRRHHAARQRNASHPACVWSATPMIAKAGRAIALCVVLGGVQWLAAARRSDRSAAAHRHSGRTDSGSSDARPTRRPNPYANDRTAMGEGRQLFVRFNCSGCHGGRAGGGMGPSLRDVDWIYGNNDAQLFSSIAEGRAHGMPSWQTRLTADQTWKLVTYIKSLRTRNEPQAPPTE